MEPCIGRPSLRIWTASIRVAKPVPACLKEIPLYSASPQNRPLSGQPYHTFGRNPAADFVLEHPSASRLHAVLQFNGDTREVGRWVGFFALCLC